MHAFLEKLKEHREHVVNFGSFIFFRVLVIGLFALTLSLFVNHAGEEKTGLLYLVLIFYNFLNLMDLGFGYALNYRLARLIARGRDPAAVVALIRKSIPFYLVAGVSATLLLFSAAEFVATALLGTAERAILIRIMSLSVFVLLLDAISQGIIKAYNKIYLLNVSRFVFDIGRSLAMLGGLLWGGDLAVVLGLIVLASLAKLAYGLYVCDSLIEGRLVDWLRPRVDWKDIALNLKFGLPMMVTTVLSLLIHNSDKLYVARFISEADLAYYAVAFDINAKVWFVLYALNDTLYTILIRRGSRRESRRNLLLVSFASVGILALFYYMPVGFLAYYILKYWINESFAARAYEIVPLLGLASVLYLFQAVLHNFLQTDRGVNLLTAANVIGLIALGGLLYLLAPAFGLHGVAASYSLMYVIMILFLLGGIYLRRRGGSAPEKAGRG